MTEITFDLDKIRSDKILSGTLYWHKKSGTTVIGNCGDLVNIDLVEKLHSGGSVLSLESIADLDLINKHITNFEKLRESDDELSRHIIRKEVISDFSDIFINNVKSGSQIDWWQICFQTFYDLPEDLENKIAGNSLIIYKRAVAVSSLTVLMAFSLGYLNYSFLKDLYNSVFITDLELFEESNFAPHTFRQLEHGRVLSLDEGIGGSYVSKSSLIKANLKKVNVENEAIYSMIRYHHENLATGQGPFKIYESEVGDLPSLYTLVQKIYPYTEIKCEKDDARGVLMSFFKENKRYIKIKKIFEAEFKQAA